MEKVRIPDSQKTMTPSIAVEGNMFDDETIYCSMFGIFPTYKYSMYIPSDVDRGRYGTAKKLHDRMVERGYKNLRMYYSNEDEDSEGKCKSLKMSLSSFMMFNDDSMVTFGCVHPGLSVLTHKGSDVIEKIIKENEDILITDTGEKVKCKIIAHSRDFYMEEFDITLRNELDFGLYNEGFDKVNEEIVRSIREDDNGLYILHGGAGTGKTTYIRHLMKQLKGVKSFVYVPSNLVDELTSPSFISFIISNKDNVFIVEDCENLIVQHANGRSSAVSDMLNMTDGLLSDALRIKFICTFNTNETNIDPALLRPGRCRVKYNFAKLKAERADAAAERLGINKPGRDVSLAELFMGVRDDANGEKKIGFKN